MHLKFLVVSRSLNVEKIVLQCSDSRIRGCRMRRAHGASHEPQATVKRLSEGTCLCFARDQGCCGTGHLCSRKRLLHECRMWPFRQEAVEKRACVVSCALSLRARPGASVAADCLSCMAEGVHDRRARRRRHPASKAAGDREAFCIYKIRPPEIRQRSPGMPGRPLLSGRRFGPETRVMFAARRLNLPENGAL